jgi:hypothetical protein
MVFLAPLAYAFFRSGFLASSEVVCKRRRDTGLERKSGNSVEGRPFSRQRQSLKCLAAVSARNEKVEWLSARASCSRVTITATDLELSVRTSCEAKVKKEGAGTIPAKKILELVRLLPEGEIKLDKMGIVVLRSTTPCDVVRKNRPAAECEPSRRPRRFPEDR